MYKSHLPTSLVLTIYKLELKEGPSYEPLTGKLDNVPIVLSLVSSTIRSNI